jgi:hypothetical protein
VTKCGWVKPVPTRSTSNATPLGSNDVLGGAGALTGAAVALGADSIGFGDGLAGLGRDVVGLGTATVGRGVGGAGVLGAAVAAADADGVASTRMPAEVTVGGGEGTGTTGVAAVGTAAAVRIIAGDGTGAAVGTAGVAGTDVGDENGVIVGATGPRQPRSGTSTASHRQTRDRPVFQPSSRCVLLSTGLDRRRPSPLGSRR